MHSPIINSVSGSNSRQLKAFRLRMLALLVVFAILLFFFGLLGNDQDMVLAGFGMVPCILVLMYQLGSAEKEVFSPLNFMLVNLMFGVTIQLIYLLYLDQGENRYGLYALSEVETLYLGAWAVTLGVFFFLIGYSIPIAGKKRLVQDVRWNGSKLAIICFLILAVSGLSLLSYVAVHGIDFGDLTGLSAKRRIYEDGVSSSQGYLRLGSSLSQLACLVLYTYLLTKGKKDSLPKAVLYGLILCTFLLGIALPFISSQRSSIIYFIISLAVLNNYCGRKWSLTKVNYIFVLLLAVLISMGILRFANGRSNALDYYVETAGISHIVSMVAGSANLLSVSKTGILLESVPEKMDFQFGTTYGLWAITPIPRSMWPEKPIVRIGGVVGPVIYDTVETSGTPPGYIGEAFLNFGWAGVPLMSLLFGTFIRYFYDRYGRQAYQNKNSALIYASLYTMICFSSISSDFTGLVSRGLQIYIPIFLILLFIRKRGSI